MGKFGWSARALARRAWAQRGRESGQTGAEYGVLIGLCAVALIAVIILFRGGVVDSFNKRGTEAGAYKPPAAVQCDQNYSGGCVPPYPPDIDCSDLEQPKSSEVVVKGSDPHNLDPDGDGIACN